MLQIKKILQWCFSLVEMILIITAILIDPDIKSVLPGFPKEVMPNYIDKLTPSYVGSSHRSLSKESDAGQENLVIEETEIKQ